MNAPLKIKLQLGSSYYDLSGITPEDMSIIIQCVAKVKEIVDKYDPKSRPKVFDGQEE